MHSKIKKMPGVNKVLHIDLMCNAGPYWSRQLAAMSQSYTFIDANCPNSLKWGLYYRPTHVVCGGGFWNSKLMKEKKGLLCRFLKKRPFCISWGYWGDGTMSLIQPAPLDMIFCSSINAVNKFKDMGCKATFAVHPVETALYYPDDTIPEIYDWCFVGTNYGTSRQQYIESLYKLQKKHIIYGQGFEPKRPVISFEQTANVFRQSKIIININDINYLHLKSYFSDRLLMGMFVKKLVLTTYQPGLERIFKRGKHIDWFSTPNELKAKVMYYLNNNGKRKAIAEEGYNLVHDKYSIKTMLPEFFDIVSGKNNDNKR